VTAKKKAKPSAKNVKPKKDAAKKTPRPSSGLARGLMDVAHRLTTRGKKATGLASWVGRAAPDFSLSDHQGRPISLGDFRGRWVTLFFFPKADTPG
jgi:hypothetical protein